MAKEKTQQVKRAEGNVNKKSWSIISQNPQKELERLGVQLSKENRESKAVSGGEGQRSQEKDDSERESQQQEKNKVEESGQALQEGGLEMDKEVEERLSKLEGIISQMAKHTARLAQEKEEEERKKAEAEERAKLEKIISTRVEEKIKPLKDSIDESLKKATEETKKMIEELKKAQAPPEPKREKIDFDSEEYQNRIIKNVIERAKPETRRKIAESLTVEERLCLENGVCPVHVVKQLEEKGFVIKKKEDLEEKKEEKGEKKEEKKRSLI